MERLIGELLAAVEAHAPVDAVCLSLHGAMAGETEIDPEGRVASGIRQIVGDVPIVAAMDLHAVISQRLVDAADALVFLHTYPHTDMRDTGQRAARLLLRQLGRGSQAHHRPRIHPAIGSRRRTHHRQRPLWRSHPPLP